MIIIIGEPLILPYSIAKEACNSLIKEYKDASITAEIGQLSEDIAYGLVSKLNGECFLAPKGSAIYTKEVCMQLTFFGLGRIEGGCNLILK